ncbi:MAG: hypothetical protein LM590_12335 [Thermofilum sp.]|nr:hypothetical protein [Thermofilum sp.]
MDNERDFVKITYKNIIINALEINEYVKRPSIVIQIKFIVKNTNMNPLE